jgi:hypothetical protein
MRSPIEWALRAGYRGVLISTFPSGAVGSAPTMTPSGRVEEAQVPVALHIGGHADGPVARRRFDPLAVLPRAATSKAGANTVPLVARMIFRSFERFTRLRVAGGSEHRLDPGDARTDRRHVPALPLVHRHCGCLPTLPSRVFHRNFWATFMIDTVGIELRHRLNLDHHVVADYPHTGTDWPNSASP